MQFKEHGHGIPILPFGAQLLAACVLISHAFLIYSDAIVVLTQRYRTRAGVQGAVITCSGFFVICPISARSLCACHYKFCKGGTTNEQIHSFS